MMDKQTKIIFYDGDCGLCQRSIRWLATSDRDHRLLFAPLNGKTYQQYFSTPAQMETVIYLKGKESFTKSSAILECLEDLPKRKLYSFLLRLIPKIIRDFFYDLVAAGRHKLTCPYFPRDERFLE